MMRDCEGGDFDTMVEIINDAAAMAYGTKRGEESVQKSYDDLVAGSNAAIESADTQTMNLAEAKGVAAGDKAEADMTEPVSLQAIKATPGLSEMALVKISRLSVSPVAADEWRTILKMGKPAKID